MRTGFNQICRNLCFQPFFGSIFCPLWVENFGKAYQTLLVAQFVPQRPGMFLQQIEKKSAKSPLSATTVLTGTRRYPLIIGLPRYIFGSTTIQARAIPSPPKTLKMLHNRLTIVLPNGWIINDPCHK